MKKNITIAALATLAAGSALAQSSVTLYGRVNTTLEQVKIGSKDVTEMRDNNSYFGLKGVEDLGGGLKASFLLESQFDADTGRAGTASNQNGTFFGRESWVALSSDSWGRLRLGNMQASAFYYATADYVSQHNGDFGTSSDAFFMFVTDPKNTVAYTTPNFYGTTVEVQWGLKETSGGGSKDSINVAVMYDNGPFHLGGGFATGPALLPPVGGPVFAKATNESESYGIRGLYDIGTFSFGTLNIGGYVNHDVLDDGKKDSSRTSYRLSSMLTNGNNEFHLNFGYADDFSGTRKTSALQYTAGYNYNLSKRTKVYAYYTGIDNDRNVYYGPGFNSGATGAPGNDFSSFAVGIRHLF
jgi:predicted porin